ncbi:hypothetical protein NQ318_006867 [Aromia moschata]|uniref:Uncharacterized protein n=1 Tax=Aromia moschata TaxID=1265417 RepID=A0AAV8YJU7_9CUCU|nr:hypothetical protein NQ318_006867 [Aromia moschata]
MGAPPSRSRDVSQPLWVQNRPPRTHDAPLSPMYSSDGQSVQVSLSSQGGRSKWPTPSHLQSPAWKPHWEEAIQCVHPRGRPKG